MEGLGSNHTSPRIETHSKVYYSVWGEVRLIEIRERPLHLLGPICFSVQSLRQDNIDILCVSVPRGWEFLPDRGLLVGEIARRA